MKISKSKNGTTVLTPEKDMYLTDGETVAEYKVWLGRLDSPERWREITAEEKAELEAEAEKALEADWLPVDA